MRINGEKVVDARQSAVIKILPIDVKKGAVKDPAACAAALACMWQLHAAKARVHIGRTYLKIDDKWVRYRTSKALRTEIIAFDRGGKFEPGEYLISPPSPQDRLGHPRPKPRGKKTGTRPRIALVRHQVTGIRQHGANR